MNPGRWTLPLAMVFSEDGWADRDQKNVLSLGWKTILETEWITNWPKAWRCGKETGILPHNYFPWKNWNFTWSSGEQVNTIAMEQFKIILFHKSGPANKQNTYHSINIYYINVLLLFDLFLDGRLETVWLPNTLFWVFAEQRLPTRFLNNLMNLHYPQTQELLENAT